MNKAHSSTRFGLSIARVLQISLALFGAGSLGAGCSSSNTGSGSSTLAPCDSTLKGQCDGPCTTDLDCALPMYCGSSGVCTADCSPTGKTCPDGYTCSEPRNRCVQGGLGFGGNTGGGADSGTCQINTFKGEGMPADIYIMNDASGSMDCATGVPNETRWEAMEAAITGFVNAPQSTGLGVGIQYFSGSDCNLATYSNPDVEIAPLPGNAGAIIQSLANHGPNGRTPTPAALQGAVDHAAAWKASHPGHAVAVVLATDGNPNECGSTGDIIGDVANIAASSFTASPSVPVYVIGVAQQTGNTCDSDQGVVIQKSDMDRIASAGGTTEAFMVDSGSGDVTSQFLGALNQIRGATVIPCQYTLPASTTTQQIDTNRIDVEVKLGSAPSQTLTHVGSEATCDASTGGWYYDNPSSPSVVLLCPASCTTVSADPTNTTVNFVVRCTDGAVPK